MKNTKKGFTLVELLIVMVIVSVLAVVAVPKYNTAVERSRSLEGILNLEKLSGEVNAMYIVNQGSYPAQADLDIFKEEAIRTQNFKNLTITRNSAQKVTLTIERDSTKGYSYTLSMINENGNPQAVTCSGTDCGMISINLSK